MDTNLIHTIWMRAGSLICISEWGNMPSHLVHENIMNKSIHGNIKIYEKFHEILILHEFST